MTYWSLCFHSSNVVFYHFAALLSTALVYSIALPKPRLLVWPLTSFCSQRLRRVRDGIFPSTPSTSQFCTVPLNQSVSPLHLILLTNSLRSPPSTHPSPLPPAPAPGLTPQPSPTSPTIRPGRPPTTLPGGITIYGGTTVPGRIFTFSLTVQNAPSTAPSPI